MRHCLRPTCGALVVKGYCAAHARRSAARRGYGRAWDRQAKAFLARYYYCGMRPDGRAPVGSWCALAGVRRLATCVDHVVPHRDDPALFDDERGNWQALCARCHGRKSAAEGAEARR
jgi:5-methylcytosine-specific restriction protein A